MINEEQRDVQSQSSIRQSRLGTCEVCRISLAKYTCPACNLITCSLPCVKKHKLDNDCDGIRPRTAYRKLPELTKLDILQDCKLLEEVCRSVEVSHKETKKASSKNFTFLPTRYYNLRNELLRRNTRLVLLPPNFARHKKNHSFLKTSSKVVFWTLQLTFLNAEKLSLMEEKWPDDQPLAALIEKYLDVSLSLEVPGALRRLKSYREAGINSIDVLLKADKVAQSDKTFYKLELGKTLGENLVGKTIVEFPQLFILIRNFYRAKPVVPSKQNKVLKLSASHKRRQSLLLPDSSWNNLSSNNANEAIDETSESEDDVEITGQESLSTLTYKDLIAK